MEFDLDDPLGDLLSEGSNDSFFDNGLKKKGSETKTSTPNKNNSKTKVSNLFGIQEKGPTPVPARSTTSDIKRQDSFDFTKDISKTPITSGPSSLVNKKEDSYPKKTEINPKSQAANKEITFLDDDLMSDLGFDPKKPKAKSSILDDLLGINSPIKKTSSKLHETENNFKTPIIGRPKAANSAKDDYSISSKQVSRQSTTETMDNQQIVDNNNFGSYSVPTQRPRSGKRPANGQVNDPLGLFSSKTEDMKRESDIKSVSRKSITSDWLGIDNEKSLKNEAAENIMLPTNNKRKTNEEMLTSLPFNKEEKVQTMRQSDSLPMVNIKNDLDNQGVQILTNIDNEMQITIENLKQQETQLAIASQMRNQENILIEMKKKQKQLLSQQEQQFSDLLQKQIQRQKVLEENINSQQDRINAHIQLLMTQPISVGNLPPYQNQLKLTNNNNTEDADQQMQSNNVNVNDDNIELKMTEIEMRNDIKKLELEKLRLDDLINNININHEQEIVLLERCYKKQIEILDENLSKMEHRLKTDNKLLENFYLNKIELIENEKNEIVKNYNEKINDLTLNYKNNIININKLHENNIESINNENKLIIENIRKAKLYEFSLLEESSSYMHVLKNAANYLENASDNLHTLRDTLQERYNHLEKDKEIQLDSREKKVEEQQKYLDRMRESTEQERTHLLELVKTLEIKLNSVTQSSTEEQWTLRQQMASLEADRVSFNREKEFLKEQQKRDEKRIEDLKKQQLTEYERLKRQTDEEKQGILLEKSKLEMMSRLHVNNDNSGSKMVASRGEIDAAVQVAQDAARQADTERERLLEMQRKYEVKKRELIDQENLLKSKQIDLEQTFNKVKNKEATAEATIKNTKLIEEKLIKKLNIIQTHTKDLLEREKKLNLEKNQLSNERIELSKLRKKLIQTRCSLCKIGEKTSQFTSGNINNNINDNNHNNNLNENLNNLPNYENIINFDINQIDKILDIEIEESLKHLPYLRTMRYDQMQQQYDHQQELLDYEIDLNMIPNITETSDSLLDPELLQLKFNLNKN